MLTGTRKEPGVGKELWSGNRAVLPSLCLGYTPIGRPMKQKEYRRQAEEPFMDGRVSAPDLPCRSPASSCPARLGGLVGDTPSFEADRRKLIPIYVVIQTHSKADDTMSAPQIPCSVALSGRRFGAGVGRRGRRGRGDGGALAEKSSCLWSWSRRQGRQGGAAVVQSTLKDARRGRAGLWCVVRRAAGTKPHEGVDGSSRRRRPQGRALEGSKSSDRFSG